ncbi:MAG: membrane protein insertion efficiency factor YidD [Planctomycetota bacterium]
MSGGRRIPPASLPFVVLIRAYQAILSPFLGGQCRFYPTCSEYAIEAYVRRGPVVGTLLTVRRLLRCQPCCRGGYDPVPYPPSYRSRSGG